jgi:hypothetical protein
MRADERTRTAYPCSLRVRSHTFTAVSRGFRKRLHKSYLPVMRFWIFADVRWGYCQVTQVRSPATMRFERHLGTPLRVDSRPDWLDAASRIATAERSTSSLEVVRLDTETPVAAVSRQVVLTLERFKLNILTPPMCAVSTVHV